jgi:unsaturated chondroitin disaccharide hydrolase
MIRIDSKLTPEVLKRRLDRFFELSAAKIGNLDKSWDSARGAPVITASGLYTSRAWTEWTQGFQFGSALLQFDATGDAWHLEYGRRNTLEHMPRHLTNFGGHDHGFNIVSTYGNLLRQAQEGKTDVTVAEKEIYRQALRVSGAVQAARWTRLADGRGYIYSFQGPHSLFVDTVRTLRSLALAHQLGQTLMDKEGERISLLDRLAQHAAVSAEYNLFYGEGRDSFDRSGRRGRVAHESLFNVETGRYCAPATQQGYSPFSTWTRGLAWAIVGFAEQLEFLCSLADEEFATAGIKAMGGRAEIEKMMKRAACATADFYIEQTPADGIPYWDTGAPGLAHLGDYLSKPADPFNDFEPVDSSAATIAAQGLWRLGNYLAKDSEADGDAQRYRGAALTIAGTLLNSPYICEEESHQGLILHSVYHRPNGWDHVPAGRRIPCGESSMWGDYHARELALLLLRTLRGEAYLTFFAV